MNNDHNQFGDNMNTSGQHSTGYTYQNSYSYGAVPPPASPRRGRTALALLAVVLCICLCFGAGAAGSLLVNRWMTQNNDPAALPLDPSDPGTPTDPVDPVSGDDPVSPNMPSAPGTATDTPVRNPLPEMNRTEPLDQVGYTGSAGENAYPTLAEAIDSVNETVVEIFTETVVSGGWLGNYITGGAGSGVIISEDGYIVTNHHVISGASSITVRTTDGTTYDAQLVGSDEASDIAVLYVKTDTSLPAASMGWSRDLIVGEAVFAIGNPLGSLGGTVTDGIISATARAMTIDGQSMMLLQTNAAVNPGNSGGGLFNMAGQLIGIVNAKSSGSDVEGLGFAIPIDTAHEVISQLIEYGYVRGVVDTGLELYDISASNILVAMRYFNMTRPGVYVLSSQYSSEIMRGDVIVSLNGETIATSNDVKNVLEGCAVGDTIKIGLVRGSEEKQVTVSLVLREKVPDRLNNGGQNDDVQFE